MQQLRSSLRQEKQEFPKANNSFSIGHRLCEDNDAKVPIGIESEILVLDDGSTVAQKVFLGGRSVDHMRALGPVQLNNVIVAQHEAHKMTVHIVNRSRSACLI